MTTSCPGSRLSSIAPDRVREHERADSEQPEHADSEDHLRRREPLVQMRPAAHHRHGHAAERARGRACPHGPTAVATGQPGNVRVRDLDGVFERVRESSQAAAEHDTDRGRPLCTGADRCDRGVELVLHGPTLHSFAVPWRWLFVAGLAALVAGGAASGAPLVKGPKVKAPAAIVIDARTGQILWSKREHMRRPIASTTKIMTALVAMERLRPNDVVRVTREAARVPWGEGLKAGERVPAWKLYYGLLLASANDTAVALAVAAGGSRLRFLKLMNQKARALGLRHTQYRSASGLIDKGNYSTVHDLAMLTRHALRNPALPRRSWPRSTSASGGGRRRARSSTRTTTSSCGATGAPTA